MTEEERLEVRKQALLEAATVVRDFGWNLPLFAEQAQNELSDDVACSVCEQIAARLEKMAVEPVE